jgi:hypothetical protein
MVKTEHHHSISWERTQQQQADYYMNIPTNVNFIINNTNQTSSLSTPPTISSSTSEKNSSSPSSEFGSITLPNHKEIYPWMSEKKHGSKKNKNNSKNHNINSNSTTSSSSGKIYQQNPT